MVVLSLLAFLQVGDLESKDPAVARRAFEAAIHAGDEKALETAARDSVQARWALAEIRAHRRFGDSYPPVPLVTLIAERDDKAEVIAEAAGSLGLRFLKTDAGRDEGVVASLFLKQVYPLEAVDELMLAINGRAWIRNRTVMYSSGTGQRLKHQSYWRHFSISASNFEVRRTLDPLTGTSTSATLALFLRHDGLCRLAGHRPLRDVEVFAGGDRPLAVEAKDPADLEKASELSMVEFTGALLRISVKDPPEGCRTLRLVRGRIPLLIPEKRSWKDFPIGEGELKLDNMTIRVESISERGDKARVIATVENPEKHHIRPDVVDFRLVGKDGSPVPARGLRHTRASDLQFDLTFEVPPGFVPAVLSMAVYESLGEHEIPFELRDIPLQ